MLTASQGYYVNLLKTISLKLNEVTVQFFFQVLRRVAEFPRQACCSFVTRTCCEMLWTWLLPTMPGQVLAPDPLWP